jgi:hypothetical protein
MACFQAESGNGDGLVAGQLFPLKGEILNLGNGQPLGEETKELALTFQCFKLLDLLPLDDHRLYVSFAEMQAFVPRDPNILFNVMFLHKLPESMFFWITVAD